MIEIIRMAKTLLTDGTIGVNAQIAALVLMGSDTAPPSITAVLDPSTDTIDVNDATALAAGPIVVCDVQTPEVGKGVPFSGVRDFTAELRLGYFAALADERALRLQAEYTRRAIMASVNLGWCTAANRPVYGRLNGINIKSVLRRQSEVFAEKREQRLLAAAVLLELDMRQIGV